MQRPAAGQTRTHTLLRACAASCLDIHREIMSAAVSGTWVFALMSMVYVIFQNNSTDTSNYFPGPHHKLGVALSLVLTFQVCLADTSPAASKQLHSLIAVLAKDGTIYRS
jgi:hypothetical protein